MSTSMPTFTRMEASYIVEPARERLKTDASQILASASRPTAIARTPGPKSPLSERGAKNHYKMTALKIRNAEEALKFSSIALKYLSTGFGSLVSRKLAC